jgi:rubrerythrin
MGKRRTDAIVECLVCHTILGTIYADELRPGIWGHSTDPIEIPKACPSCHEPPVRTMQPEGI